MEQSLVVPRPAPAVDREPAVLERRGSAIGGKADHSTELYIAACAGFLVLLLIGLFRINSLNDQHLVYALDDAYIHLSLSEQIAHGHYGINPAEFSAPASSILWPFLLAPFASLGIHPYMPLLFNLVFGLVAVFLLAKFVVRWLPAPEGGGLASWTLQLLTVLLLTLAANLISLPLLGMEHVLQVMLAIACAYGISLAWGGLPIPWWSLLAATVIPLVRYESMTLTLAMVVTLAATRRLRLAALVLAGASFPLLGFSLFLHHLGLQWLPSSVLLKLGHPVPGGGVSKLGQLLMNSYRGLEADPTRWPLLALTLLTAILLLPRRTMLARVILSASAMAGAAHLVVGGFGWFHRYEVYAVIFMTLIALRAMADDEPEARMSRLLALFLLAAPYANATLQTPDATHEIYRQQVQMHRFLDDYYRKDVAVNDIGLTSYRRPPGVFILDLWGLSWYEAGVANRTPEWLQSNLAKRHIGLAMLYPDQFDAPDAWKVVGELCLRGARPPIVAAGNCVDFYGTTPESAVEVERELRQFVPTLPAGTSFTFGPPQP